MKTITDPGGHVNPVVGRPVDVLLIEDSPSDVAMTLAALNEGRIANIVHVVSDGEEEMAYLHRTGKYAEMPRPDLILLDLNLPKKDGREILVDLKTDERLKVIPVVILTTSSADVDIVQSYELHANSYVTKPVGFEAFLRAIRGIEDFWLSLVRLPSGFRGG